MKIVYFANIRLPTEKAHGIQIMKTGEALAQQGVPVELVLPKRHNEIKGDPFDFYGIEKDQFKITRLWSLDIIWWSLPKFWKRVAFWKQSATFAWSVWRHGRGRQSVLYTRDLILALVLSKEKLFYEVHWLPEKIRWHHQRAYKRVKGLVVISNGIKNDLLKLGIPEKKICVARDAVDLKQFQIKISREAARKRLSLPPEQKIAVYTGHLYDWKGADVLARAAKLLSEDTHVYLVGGTDEDIKRFKKSFQASNLHIVGWRKHEEIPLWLAAADVLVLPNSAKKRIGAKDTSPLKIFEYMAAGRPIVAADLPAIREVLDNDTAELVAPDDPARLALGIKAALERKELSRKRVQAAQEKVRECTWENRVRHILEFISSHKS